MKFPLIILLSAWFGCALAAPVDVPHAINHLAYDRLLKKYVDDRGLVNYAAWKASAEDIQALRNYTGSLRHRDPFAEGDSKVASLINAYNALTLQWILDNYPVKSIKDTNNPWGAKRHFVGGRKVSLDEIEHDTLRPTVGYRVHACLVCAAKSCPPLRNAAYMPDKLNEQLDERMRAWLAREDLNRFLPDKNRVELSKIFDWYGKDFVGVRGVLEKYAPESYREFLKGKFGIDYLRYNWSLNEQPTASR